MRTRARPPVCIATALSTGVFFGEGGGVQWWQNRFVGALGGPVYTVYIYTHTHTLAIATSSKNAVGFDTAYNNCNNTQIIFHEIRPCRIHAIVLPFLAHIPIQLLLYYLIYRYACYKRDVRISI